MLVCSFFLQFAHEIAGAARIRHSLRPLIGGGESYLQTSGAVCRENAKLFPRHCERSEAIHVATKKEEWIASLRSQ
jgi:hypothetical protein